jgi:hypothetical protein
MATSRARTRPKKLNTKQTVPIFREDQVEPVIEIDASRGLVESGVEKSEENARDFLSLMKMGQLSTKVRSPTNILPGISSTTGHQGRSRRQGKGRIHPNTADDREQCPV